MEEQKLSSSSFAEVWSAKFNIFKEKLHTSAWLFQQPFFPGKCHTQLQEHTSLLGIKLIKPTFHPPWSFLEGCKSNPTTSIYCWHNLGSIYQRQEPEASVNSQALQQRQGGSKLPESLGGKEEISQSGHSSLNQEAYQKYLLKHWVEGKGTYRGSGTWLLLTQTWWVRRKDPKQQQEKTWL